MNGLALPLLAVLCFIWLLVRLRAKRPTQPSRRPPRRLHPRAAELLARGAQPAHIARQLRVSQDGLRALLSLQDPARGERAGTSFRSPARTRQPPLNTAPPPGRTAWWA